MDQSARHESVDQARIMLGLLDSVERNGAQSQRRLASELGIALGLVNTYLRRCMKKGLLKATQAPARRYVYYLTPKGFAEKSRLTVEYLSYSFSFFRQAKEDCAQLFEIARRRELSRVALAGKSDLAEIASICALEAGIEIVGIIDPAAAGTRFLSHPQFARLEDVCPEPQAVVITDMTSPRETFEALAAIMGRDRVLVPALLRVYPGPGEV